MVDKLLLESGDDLLLEIGDFILLESSFNAFYESLSDSLTISDDLTKNWIATISLTESFNITDSLSYDFSGAISLISERFKLGITNFNNQLIKHDKVIKLRKGGDLKLK